MTEVYKIAGDNTMSPPEILIAIGLALAGPEWRSWLAAELGVNRTTVNRWASGYSRIPPGVWRELQRLVDARIARLDHLKPLLAKHIDLPSAG
jgi:DNA-binding transcriptional regulator YdaS (Cro superfamily)